LINMEQNKVIKYDKLIRDRIPEIIEKHGNKAIVEVLDEQDFAKYLKLKLAEEMQEYLDSGSVEELADLVEVVYALLDCAGVSHAEFEAIRKAKVEERGSFTKKLLLREVISK
jgi:predicted house-cleaning noncanonical NTP pyrophosphatase (MazG superfamily)